jgi:hypothetical protein
MSEKELCDDIKQKRKQASEDAAKLQRSSPSSHFDWESAWDKDVSL